MMTDGTDTDNNLQGAFGDRGTNVNAISYGHPHGDKIIEEAREVIALSETGRTLLKVIDHHRIPIQIIKGMGASGFNPQARVIYLQMGGKVKESNPDIILQLIRGLRQADQELIGFTAPDPTKDLIKYATAMHAKALDSIVYMCRVVKELTDSEYFEILLDEIRKLGHINVYKAFDRDATKEELFDAYSGK